MTPIAILQCKDPVGPASGTFLTKDKFEMKLQENNIVFEIRSLEKKGPPFYTTIFNVRWWEPDYVSATQSNAKQQKSNGKQQKEQEQQS